MLRSGMESQISEGDSLSVERRGKHGKIEHAQISDDVAEIIKVSKKSTGWHMGNEVSLAVGY